MTAIAALAACGSDTTAPSTNPSLWADGRWVAVRANGKPLPYQDSPNYPFVRYDSLIISVIVQPTSATAVISPWPTLYFSAALAPSAIVCAELGAVVSITDTQLFTFPKGATTSIGNCSPVWVTFSLTRKADSLAGTWQGLDLRFVKR